jgi:NAD-dependent deacetylase
LGGKWPECREAGRALAMSRHAIALTGAGVSTPSGIPDFRGPQGLWSRVDPELFHISYFMADPLTVWKLYMELYRVLERAKPNRAHRSLAILEKAGLLKAVITQNIDGLHQKAGSMNVVELHGNGFNARCTRCGKTYPITSIIERALEENEPPRCPRCGGLLKPDVVFFGETLPEEALRRALGLAWKSDLILVAGSSLAVSPANQLPWIVKRRGGVVIIVNLGETYFDKEADIKIEGPVEEVLPCICSEALKAANGDRGNISCDF